MRPFGYLLCYSTLVATHSLYAICTPATNPSAACSTVGITANISADGTSSGASPVIVYQSGWKNPGSWGGNVDFGTYDSSINTPFSAQDVAITFGTLSTTLPEVTLKGVSTYPDGNNYSMLNQTPDSTAHLDYTVQYMACNNDTLNSITSISSPTLTAGILMAGSNPACQPATGSAGNGAGELIFNVTSLPPYSAGTYQDTFNLTVCTTSTCN